MDDMTGDGQLPIISVEELFGCLDDNIRMSGNCNGSQFSLELNRVHGSDDSLNTTVLPISEGGKGAMIDENSFLYMEKKNEHLFHQAKCSTYSINEFGIGSGRSGFDISDLSFSETFHKTFIREESSFKPEVIAGSSCSSPPVTPTYSDVSIGLNQPTSNIVDDCQTILNSLTDGRMLDIPAFGDWKITGDPTEITCTSAVDGSSSILLSFSSMQHIETNTVVSIGDVILLRRPTQEWFDRSPLIMEVVSIRYDSKIATLYEGTMSVRLRRYFGIFQVSCRLPEIAQEMVNRESVVFDSQLPLDILTPDCVFVGCGLILSLSEYYRYWAEISRLRQGRRHRRCPVTSHVLERWSDWLEKPDQTFVFCGTYDLESKTIDPV